MEIGEGHRTRVVHINRLQPRLQESSMEDNDDEQHSMHVPSWEPAQVDHYFVHDASEDNPGAERQEQRRYPVRERKVPERYGLYFCHACGQADNRGERMYHACELRPSRPEMYNWLL